MGRAPCCDKAKVKRGPWSSDEDAKLKSYIQEHGTGGNWIALPQKIGLKRCGKSCRLRWLNYLRPNIKHGGFSDEEDNVICALYMTIGSRWSIIAAQLPGRTDNDIKNYWNTKLKKKLLNKQRTEIQEAARRSKTSYTTNSNTIIVKRESYLAAAAAPTTNIYDHDDQYLYWAQQYQLAAMATHPSPSQQQNNIINTNNTSNLQNHPEDISTINDFEDQFYGDLDFSSIYSTIMTPVNNYTAHFQSFNNNFGMNDKTVYSMEKICNLSSGVETVNGSSNINGTTSTSAESTVSWGGEYYMNPNLVCSPMVSMISYEDNTDRHHPEIMQCAFEDQQQQQQQHLGFYQ